MRKFYNYNSETRGFTSEDEADPNPLVPGDYLLPAYATFKPPPETIEVGTWPYHDAETDDWVVKPVPAEEAAPIDLSKQMEEIPSNSLLGDETIGDLFNA